MPLDALRRFFATESAGGVAMLLAAVASMTVANSPLAGEVRAVLAQSLGFDLGPVSFVKPALLWINDGLMAVFFLLVGLEIKREVTGGELSSRESLALPVAAAIGGMLLPALLFALINRDDPIALRGWAIPAATDIAFSLAVLTLFGTRVPLGLKLFLTAVAIVDDLGAIVVIAIFYTEQLSLGMLGLALCGLVVLAALNLGGVRRVSVYLLVGLITWACVLKSGVHATLAGVATAFAIPFTAGDGESPGQRLEERLHPSVVFGILPLFAFANAGVEFAGVGLDTLLHPLPLGIAVGLVLGKSLGIFAASALAIRARLATRPEGANSVALLGIATLGGIGFTMSLFIGSLAFETQALGYFQLTRLGVVVGSLISALVGCGLLALGLRGQAPS
jgi:Na+:H+ antiporter, NhaA family